jgi:hypothetical protein
MPMTERARVLREVRTFEKMAIYLRSRAAPRAVQKPVDPEELEEGEIAAPEPEVASDLTLCEALELLADQGRKLADRLVATDRPSGRRGRGVAAFMEVAYAVKADFFFQVGEADDWHPV